jgi:regulator of nonsense transcripts 2
MASFYTVKPPPSGPRKRVKEYPPLEAYLRHLLMTRLSLSNSSCSFVAKQIARMPWHDPSQQCGALVCRLMLKAARKGRYKTIQSIAIVASNLRTQRAAGEATVRLVDAVLEELCWALESPNFRDQQRTITYARLLGELYCSSQVSAQVILKQLYDFINLGHEIPESLREASKKLAAERAQEPESGTSQLPVYNSSSGVSQTIQEDEEMEEEALQPKEEDPKPEEPKPVAVSEYSKYDPRVPSPLDTPNSAYRIKLVCTLLEVVAKQITSRNNLPRVKGFLTAFQRYLFTKVMLPTDVEFALLDTFDILDSQWRRLSKGSRNSDSGEKETGFSRFASWLEAHNATVAIEESEALFEQQQRAKIASGMDESKDGNSLNDEDDNEDGTASGGSLSLSGKDSLSDGEEAEQQDMDHEGEDEEQSQSSSEGDDDDETDSEGETDEEDEEEFDEEAYMRQMEEEAFERELRRVTMDALEKGKSVSRKLVGDSMPSGSQIIKKKQAGDGPAAETPSHYTAIGGKAGISFQVLKKGNKGKMEAKELIVPSDTNLAMVATKQDGKAARERDVIKQRVLRYEAESAEAEYSGGNVYLEQEKLQVIRNRPLSMTEIDKNFGTSGGNLRDKAKSASQPGRAPSSGRGGRGQGGRGRGRGSASGRTLFG